MQFVIFKVWASGRVVEERNKPLNLSGYVPPRSAELHGECRGVDTGPRGRVASCPARADPLARVVANNMSEAEEEPQKFTAPDPSKWPDGIRVISLGELDALGVDADGRLYWHGKPVEVGRRLDLTKTQAWVAVIVAAFTVIGSIGAVAQGWAAYNDWACKTGWRVAVCAASLAR